MPDLFLILHKVRGEPAFDIAQKLCQGSPCQPRCGGWDGTRCVFEEDWIIPTSGHRAHPAQMWKLFDIVNISTPTDLAWEQFPDHYQTTSEPRAKVSLAGIVAKLTKPLGLRRI